MRPKTKSILKRLLLAASLSWIFSVTLGLLLAAQIAAQESGSAHESRSWFSYLMLPGVIPVTLVGSTCAALGMTPAAVWSVRTGTKNLWIYGPVLWIVLATYEVVVIHSHKGGVYVFDGPLLLGIVGAAILGFIPPAKRH
jgi:hypothetical protein